MLVVPTFTGLLSHPRGLDVQWTGARPLRRGTHPAHGRFNPSMSAPGHIEVGLVGREQAFAKSAASEPEKKKVSQKKLRKQRAQMDRSEGGI